MSIFIWIRQRLFDLYHFNLIGTKNWECGAVHDRGGSMNAPYIGSGPFLVRRHFVSIRKSLSPSDRPIGADPRGLASADSRDPIRSELARQESLPNLPTERTSSVHHSSLRRAELIAWPAIHTDTAADTRTFNVSQWEARYSSSKILVLLLLL